jgi:hypothetical protein
MIDTLAFELCHFDSSRKRKKLCDTLTEEIGCGVWYERFNTVNTEWLWLTEKLLRALHTDNYACAVAGLYPAYTAGVLRGFEEKINIYIATSRLSELDIRTYVDNAVSTKTCTVQFLEEEKGKQIRTATDEQSVTVNSISQCANDEPANFSLNMLFICLGTWTKLTFRTELYILMDTLVTCMIQYVTLNLCVRKHRVMHFMNHLRKRSSAIFRKIHYQTFTSPMTTHSVI